jgi:kynurenine formamidase
MKNLLLPLSLIALAGCRPAQPASDLAALFADEVTVVDLTHAISARAPYWPGPPTSPFRHDAPPVHGGMGLPSVDRVATRELFGPAVVIDVTRQAETDEDYALTTGDILAWEAAHGLIPPGAIVLMRSGWATRWEQGDPYYNQGEDRSLHFPGFGEDAARLLVEERDIAGIGVDTGSVDPGNASGFPTHGVVNGAGRFHLENLADLSALPESGAYLIVAPIKIEGGSGGQVRVFAVVP